MMLALKLVLVFTIPVYLTIDTVEGIVYITGYVGETIELRCLNSSPRDVLRKGIRDVHVSWMYLFQDDGTDISTYVKVAKCEMGSWECLSYGHQLVGSDGSCDNGLAYIRSREPGHFTYKCEEKTMSKDRTDVIREETFMITIHALDNASISTCLAKYVPSSQNMIFDFICRSYSQRDCLNKADCDNVVFIQRNGVRIIPDISLTNKIVARIEIKNIGSISQQYCIHQNHSSPCVVDTVTLYNPVGITPIVNQVIEGGDAIFECSFKDGHETNEKYEWRFSPHIEFSRISGTASSTLKIYNVQSESDGVIMTCAVDVKGTIFHSEALLRILSLGGSFTTASYSPEVTTNLLQLATQLFNLTTSSTSIQCIGLDSCKLLMMCFLIPVFGVLLIVAVMVLAVYCWTRDIPGQYVVQI